MIWTEFVEVNNGLINMRIRVKAISLFYFADSSMYYQQSKCVHNNKEETRKKINKRKNEIRKK
jgi:hypothetical protein